eukprot:TRINITY_DN25380_c0_g1_i1.p1 TRINITY_DN25380_c0_g1~~TRINITY_DN25380_c0_g1_i1.p1  ORF type:complete len:1280 (+),score=181.68 TRINITY_DN25380_c0_g1_i1:105-3944(+)
MGQVCITANSAKSTDECEAEADTGRRLQLVDEPTVKFLDTAEAVVTLEEESEKEVVLAWEVSSSAQRSISAVNVRKLNEHVSKSAEHLKCEILIDEAVYGLIRGRPVRAAIEMSAEDVVIRFGQLLCRWAVSNGVKLRAGVGVGRLSVYTMQPSGRKSFYGEACAEARDMLSMSSQDQMVHLKGQVKDNLMAFQHLPLIISRKEDSYYLDPTATAHIGNSDLLGKEADVEGDVSVASLTKKLLNQDKLDVTKKESDGDMSKLSFDVFKKLLKRHGVETSKFGVGIAKPLAEFYESVVHERKCYLTVNSGILERVVNLVRISLRIRDDDHRLRELRIKSERTSTGHLRVRDQPLAIVLKVTDIQRWQDLVGECLEEKLGVSMRMQKLCFTMDMESYSLDEDRAPSDTIPGVVTTYKAHNVVMHITDKENEELSHLGLPNAKDFQLKKSNGLVEDWNWSKVEHPQEDALMDLLKSSKIDVSEFAPRCFAELREEVYGNKTTSLEVENGELVRKIRVLKLWLHADILNVDHVLVVRSKWQNGFLETMTSDTPITMRFKVDQTWQTAVQDALKTRLSLSPQFQQEHIDVDMFSHKFTEEIAYSKSFPGLRTLYRVTEISAHVRDSNSVHCSFIGLPFGTDFTVSRRQDLKGPEQEQQVVTHWYWTTQDEINSAKNRLIRRSLRSGPSLYDAESSIGSEVDGMECLPSDELLVGRTQLPEPLIWKSSDVNPKKHSIAVLRHLMSNKKTDWALARKIAERIRNPKYTCKKFYEDVNAAFPELRLYYICRNDNGESQDATTSGRTPDDEYQRTIGALFTVFWMMRIDMGGKESICFGLDSKWNPNDANSKYAFVEPEEVAKRKTFFENTRWDAIEKLLIDAKLLRREKGELVHDKERTLTLIVLMVIHDIMKLTDLLPFVSREMKEFCGYKAGETIHDHDIALSYVLITYPDALPSYTCLNKSQRQLVQFVHCKMDYNMGWLVQAEAPPGALFRNFKSVIQKGAAPSADVTMYFVHWFADLAGAEPCPLHGCNKFVLRFPHRVLSQFLDSFSIVQQLGTSSSETQVLEDYYAWRWRNSQPSLGSEPQGEGAIAQMRLVMMAQGDSQAILKEFNELSSEEKRILSEEMAMTGRAGQKFQRDPGSGKGPAFLVYYGPALMQKAGKSNPGVALRILVEVYHQARKLWPSSSDNAEQNVIIRIDAIKDLECRAIVSPDSTYAWVLTRTSNKDGTVKLVEVSALPDMDQSLNLVLQFSQCAVPKEATRNSATSKTSYIPLVRRFSLWSSNA